MVIEIFTCVLLLSGATLALLAAVGIVKLPDALMRMQASAKASTLGLTCLLIGAALQIPDVSSIIRLASIEAFVMLTAPLSAHVVARAAFRRKMPLWEGARINERDLDPDCEVNQLEPPEATRERS
ncbi:MAG: monovalent cation/H(+) antiporter subunit G [Polyangiaceae bacterium]|nr:monovalent cation/H(+) antiporter subunit G [Polyangiaceae bacterium]MCW5792511.1 monovalent cation/H(+) antiporter subunit G [Polyangiaceae bacterium]